MVRDQSPLPVSPAGLRPFASEVVRKRVVVRGAVLIQGAYHFLFGNLGAYVWIDLASVLDGLDDTELAD